MSKAPDRSNQTPKAKAKAKAKPKAKPEPNAVSKFDLYELCVTEPVRLTRFLRAVHGNSPRTLREDFSGSAALARYWAQSDPRASALAVDVDPEPLALLKGLDRVETIRGDALQCRRSADVIACTNFPLGYWHTRAALVKYLSHARACLNSRGVLVADTYGGRDALIPGQIIQHLVGPDDERIEYTFEQRSADPITARVVDALSFRVTPARKSRATIFRDAFVYDWRLWSIPELTDALHEAGFKGVEVHDRLGGAIEETEKSSGTLRARPITDGQELDDNYVVYVVARK